MQSNSGHPTYDSKIATDLVIALGESPNQEEVLCRCPICGDSQKDPNKKRFAVNLRKSKYYCFNCLANGETIEMAQLLMNIGHILSEQKANTNFAKAQLIKFSLVTVPVKSLPPTIRQEVINDLLPRKVFTKEEIGDLDYCVAGSRPKKWVGRVVIEADGLKFGKAIKKGITPKYLTQPNFRLIEHGYINMAQVLRDGDPSLLVEGLLDLKSIPLERGLMSPGTSGMFNDMLKSASREVPIIVVPDSDNAGVEAFLRIVNKGMLEDPNAHLRFCFAYWVTNHIGDDINDMRVGGLTKQDIYDTLVSKSLPGIVALDKLKQHFDIVHGPKGWMIKKEKKVEQDGSKRSFDKKDRGPKGNSGPKKGKNGRDDGLSWF